jgi:CRISPR-associated protein Cas1
MKKNYYLFNSGRLSRKDNTLKFTINDENGNPAESKYIPIENVDQLYVFGAIDINNALLNFLGQNQVFMHFFDYYENYTGSFTPREYLLSGKSLIYQAKYFLNKKKRLSIAKKILDGAIFNMLKNLKYYQNRGKNLEEIINFINQHYKNIENSEKIEELMGIEGNIRENYYKAFDIILKEFNFEYRSKQPPHNELNAMISFGNMLCYTECLRAIHHTHLNPTISFLHEPSERRFSLALDLAEIFKPILVDRLIFTLVNKKIIQSNDFEKNVYNIKLKENAKKLFIENWDKKLNETFLHRTLNRNVSYKHLLKLECYKIEKEILEIEEYKPFKSYW